MATAMSASQIPSVPAASAPRLELNGPAPDFEASTTAGPVKLSEWQKGKWVVLFSHPADFTPVCTTEFVEFARRTPDFEKRDVALLGSSVDSVYSHIAWIRNIEEKLGVKITFPVIADLDQKVSRLYGMIHEPSSVTAPVRCVFFIDPKRTLRAMIWDETACQRSQYGSQFGSVSSSLLLVVVRRSEQWASKAFSDDESLWDSRVA